MAERLLDPDAIRQQAWLISTGQLDGYDDDERLAVRWQQLTQPRSWESQFWSLVERSDEEHLDALAEGFPDEIRVYRRWTREREFAADLRDKSGLPL